MVVIGKMQWGQTEKCFFAAFDKEKCELSGKIIANGLTRHPAIAQFTREMTPLLGGWEFHFRNRTTSRSNFRSRAEK